MLPQTSNPCLTTEVADPLETLRFRISFVAASARGTGGPGRLGSFGSIGQAVAPR
jgi:hypothetical protein